MSSIKETLKKSELTELARIRGELNQLEGRQYWRSLEELAQTDEFKHFLHREFPENASEWTDPKGRRNFLRLMGASLALAGVGACTKQPLETIVPYVRQPENVIPGRPLFYATAMSQGGIGHPLLVESHLGRPTKVEGNKEHPASQGATNAFAQASILSLYDPDRSTVPIRNGRQSNWDTFLSDLNPLLAAFNSNGGQGLKVLTSSIGSPTLSGLLKEVGTVFPQAGLHQWDPLHRDEARRGIESVAGRPLQESYDLTQAKVIVSLGADFLVSGPSAIRHAREFSAGRRIRHEEGEMNRLYAIESTPSLTGGMADHRWAVRPSELAGLATQLANAVSGGAAGSAPDWIQKVAADLTAAGSAGLVIAGDEAPAGAHAAAHAINNVLGSSAVPLL